jgi:hypothetical protein
LSLLTTRYEFLQALRSKTSKMALSLSLLLSLSIVGSLIKRERKWDLGFILVL